MDKEIFIFEANIGEYIDSNTKKTIRNILNVLDANYPSDSKRASMRKVILDNINELNIIFKHVVSNIKNGM